jgi:hypothetical protein
MTFKFYQGDKKAVDVKAAGTASIGDVAAQVSEHLKAQVWMAVTVRRCDGKDFWVENAGKYQSEQVSDAESDPRLKLRVRYDAPDRTFVVEEIRFDPVEGDLSGLLEDLKGELGF